MQAVQCNKLYTVVCIVHCIAHFTLQRRQRGWPILLGTVPSLPHLQFTANCSVFFCIHWYADSNLYNTVQCNVHFFVSYTLRRPPNDHCTIHVSLDSTWFP